MCAPAKAMWTSTYTPNRNFSDKFYQLSILDLIKRCCVNLIEITLLAQTHTQVDQTIHNRIDEHVCNFTNLYSNQIISQKLKVVPNNAHGISMRICVDKIHVLSSNIVLNEYCTSWIAARWTIVNTEHIIRLGTPIKCIISHNTYNKVKKTD